MAEMEARGSASGWGDVPWWVFLITGLAWEIIAVIVLRFDVTSVATVGFLLGALWGFIHPYDTFFALASVLGLILVFMGTLEIIKATMTRDVNPLWGLGLVTGILLLFLGIWASQQFYPARAELILLWVGFMAMFRGIGQIVLAFGVRKAARVMMA